MHLAEEDAFRLSAEVVIMMELVTPSAVFTEKHSKEQLAVPWTEVEALIAMAQAAIQAKTAAGGPSKHVSF